MPKSIHRAEYRRIIDTLRDRREALGLTQTALARSLRRFQQWVSLLECGDRRLDVVEYVEICTALALDPQELLASLMNRLRHRGELPAPSSHRRTRAPRKANR